jgi:ATP-dependent helicase/nuclease subunit A
MTSNHVPVPSDSEVRSRAISRDQSFIVQAPAGSGKTELLMQRFLNVLADPTIAEPESVLAITFTRKAAAEMRNRILEALEDAGKTLSETLPPHKQKTREIAMEVLKRDMERGWRLLENPSRLQVRTVDSFCDSLVRQLPLRAGFGAAADVDIDPKPLYEEAARRTVLMLGDPDERTSKAVEQLLAHLDNNLRSLQQLIVGMLEKREQWLRLIGGVHMLDEQELEEVRHQKLEPALADAVRYELGILREALTAAVPGELWGRLLWFMRYAGSNLEENNSVYLLRDLTVLPGTEPDDVGKWKALHKFFFDSKQCVRGSLSKLNGFPREGKREKEECLELFATLNRNVNFVARVQELCERLFKLPATTYTDAQWEVIRALFWILPRAVANLKIIFGEVGRVDFSEVAQGAAHALGTPDEPTDLSFRVGGRIRHILVDEFQDTSVAQVELLKALIATWEQTEGNTLFVVGDPMQSIYSFREAEVVLFQRTREQGIAGWKLQPEELCINFRSQLRLIDWFNASFPNILTEDNHVSGAVSYTAADAIRPAGPAPVSIEAFATKNYQAEAQRVLELIEQALVDNSAGMIAILVRARSHLTEIVKTLRSHGIRFRAVKIDSLGERQAVLDIDALTRALIHFGDRTSWLAVLRGPYCGLDLSDIWAVCREDKYTAIWDLMQQRFSMLSADGQRRLARVIPVLAAMLDSRGRIPLRTWVESAWISLGGPASVRPGTDGEADIRDVHAYLDLLQSTAVAGELPDPQVFRQKLGALFAPADTADDIRVEIMTIHNAKGLEFDTVIVPGLGRPPKADDQRLLYWWERVLDGKVQLLLGPIEAATAAKDSKDGTIEGYLRQIEKDRAHEESKRLLYVAATRAKRKLHLLGHIPEPGANPDHKSLLATLWAVPEIAAKFMGLTEPERVTDDTTDVSSTARLRRLPLDWQMPSPPAAVEWPAPIDESDPKQAHTFIWVSDTLRRVGTVTHGFLQQIGREGLSSWDDHVIEQRISSIRGALLGAGVSPAAITVATDKVIASLKAVLQDATGRWVLDAHQDAQNEFELSGLIDNEVRRIKLDRTFIEGGERWIVDYKVTDIEGGSREDFLKAQVEKYREDMQIYRRVMAAFDPRPIRLALYFPLLRELCEVQ